ncbi:MAG: TIGR04282 family arsenosugar biosynthesis glycosyltransferase [Verrucomicrobiales bacterium]|nr:TIGR04282 family arsenosugar biosynthesis glycosyltransferase [Verrucomicrobiales bacterium]
MKSPRIIVFLKIPRPGSVKTRIAATLDADAAAAIYRVLIQRTLGALAEFENVELRYAPDDAAKEIQPWLRRGWTCAPQGEGDLGQRMQRAVLDAMAADQEAVILIGTDCPAMEAEDLQAAARALENQDAVLGPATDGGYWLLGLGRRAAAAPAVWFHDIPWSTDQVQRCTLEKARAAGLTCGALRPLRDVDTVEDWREWQRTAPL